MPTFEDELGRLGDEVQRFATDALHNEVTVDSSGTWDMEHLDVLPHKTHKIHTHKPLNRMISGTMNEAMGFAREHTLAGRRVTGSQQGDHMHMRAWEPK